VFLLAYHGLMLNTAVHRKVARGQADSDPPKRSGADGMMDGRMVGMVQGKSLPPWGGRSTWMPAGTNKWIAKIARIATVCKTDNFAVGGL